MRLSTAARPNIFLRSSRPRSCRSCVSMVPSLSLQLRNAGGLAHAVPAPELICHEGTELGRGRALHHDPRGLKAFAHGLVLQDFVDRAVEPGDDGGRQAARPEHAVPGGHVVPRDEARLDRGRHGGHCRKALLAGDRERLELAPLHLADQRGTRVEQHVDLAARDRGDRLGRGAERHVQHLDAGRLHEQLGGEVLGRTEARAREHDLFRLGPCLGDQALHVVGGEIRARDDQEARGRELRHRLERRERVVAQALVDGGGDDLPRRHDAERVAVLLGAGDELVAERAGGAGLVLDHERLAEPLLQRLADDAADDVGAAPRAEADDDAHRALRPLLGERRCAQGHGRNRGGDGNQCSSHCELQWQLMQGMGLWIPYTGGLTLCLVMPRESGSSSNHRRCNSDRTPITGSPAFAGDDERWDVALGGAVMDAVTVEARTEVRDGMRITWHQPIVMDDGLVLRADMFRPVDAGRYPVILTYGIYAKGLAYQDGYPHQWEKMVADHPEILQGSTTKYQNWAVNDPERWVPHGYVVIRVDSRGAGWSPGVMDPNSDREITDLYQCIEWAGKEPWSNGKVGMLGISYYASNQWRVAVHRPPHLSAIIPWEGQNDRYRDSGYHGGILSRFQN